MFTKSPIPSKRKMGMILVSKLQWMRHEKLTYVARNRTFIHISRC